MLSHVYSARLERIPSHLRVESEEAESRMLGKATVVVHHEVLEVVSDGDLILSSAREVSSTGREESGKCAGEVSLSC